MRVAIITSGFFPVIDGVTVAVFQRVQRLSQLGHQVLVLCPDYGPIASIYPDWQTYVGNILPGARVVALESSPFMGLEFERNVKKTAYPALLQALADFQPDLIHVDEPERLQLGFNKIPAIDFAREYNIPAVAFLHTNLIEYLEDYFPLPRPVISGLQCVSRRIVSRIYNAYDATFINSRITFAKAVKMGIQNAVQAELLGIPLAQYNLALRQADFFATHYHLPDLEKKVKLLFLGRLTPDKGWKFTIEAFTQIARSSQYSNLMQSIVLIIAGDGSMQTKIAQALQPLSCPVYFLGRISPQTVPALLINSDIHITTSEKETCGLTVLEAGAAGIPVLAPAAGGIIDTVQPGQTGFLFQPRNEQDFAAKLWQLVTQPDLRQQMGQTARQQATQQDWNPAIDRLIQLWQQHINQR